MRLGPLIAFVAGSGALIGLHQIAERRHRARELDRPPEIPPGGVGPPGPEPLPPAPIPPSGPPSDIMAPEVEQVPTCPEGQIVIPYEDGWFCIDEPPEIPEEGGACEDEGAWSEDLECVEGTWQVPEPGGPCSTDGLWHEGLHCADGQWSHPTWNGPCHPSGSFTPDGTLHCVDTTWQPTADGRPCRLPGDYNPTGSPPLYCGDDLHWHAFDKGERCPKEGERAPGRSDLICYEGRWKKTLKCAAAAAACTLVPIPGLPRFECWSIAPGKNRCDGP